MPPGVLRGDLYLAYANSQMNPQTWTKVGAIGPAVWQLLMTFEYMFDPLKTPKCPLVSLRAICLAYIHSQMNLHMYATFDANRTTRLTSSSDFLNCDPLTPPPNVEGWIVFSLCPCPDESADVYQIWCQSVQPFGTFSWICATLVRLLATGRAVSRKNTPKKQHLHIENYYNSGPDMQTSTSLTFFTAIFVALGGALAEVLMICCRHVRTELYI